MRRSCSSATHPLLSRSEVVIRAKLRRLGTASPAERPRSLEEVIVQMEPPPSPSGCQAPAVSGTAAGPARIASVNKLCEAAAGGERVGRSATLPRAAPTPCFYMHAPPPPPPSVESPVVSPELGRSTRMAARSASGSSACPAERRATLVCGVPETEMRSMGVSVCVLMVMLAGLAIVYGFFMGY